MKPTSLHPVVVDTSTSTFARLLPLRLDQIQLTGSFWAERIRTNRTISLPLQFEQIVRTGRLANFRRASGKLDQPYQGYFFNDSDVYKWMEGAAWALATERDPALEAMLAETITEIGAAQEPNGYLDTYFARERAGERWSNLRDLHELYCAGHLFQAAIAHRRATGRQDFWQVALRLADHLVDTFGPQGKPGTPGHPEVELALVEMYRASHDRRYLDQAAMFLDNRGKGLIGGREYHQDHVPYRAMEQLAGHAVRALYLSAGAADLYLEQGDPALLAAMQRMWKRMVSSQLYVTGGAGARFEGEAFGADYELPNARAYAETCAAIASLMWNWRLLQITSDAVFADAFEQTLYNGFLAGVSLDGKDYFYMNPLESDGSYRREPWFSCACCPPNVARTLAILPGYFYSLSAAGLWVHQYSSGEVSFTLPGGAPMSFRQSTRYPWDGTIELEALEGGELSLFLRLPGWVATESVSSLALNGKPVEIDLAPGSYAQVNHTWKPGDILRLELPMPVTMLESHPYVAENAGKVALRRGPCVYCLEGVDQPGTDLRDVVLPAHPEFALDQANGLPGEVIALQTWGATRPPGVEWASQLYRPVGRGTKPGSAAERTSLVAVPYYAWANRAPGQMRVWIRREIL